MAVAAVVVAVVVAEKPVFEEEGCWPVLVEVALDQVQPSKKGIRCPF